MTDKHSPLIPHRIIALMEKGVQIPNPFTVDIGDEVPLDRISGDGVRIYGGTRIYGQSVLISRGVQLGYEAPVTLQDCQLGQDVQLKGGFYRSSVFLDGTSTGSGSQIREGCLLEEEASTAHTVGLKQTILFPFVTLGSLINFCDCLMAGGTSRKDHSEVGSSYIHFNYTPQQDKATPSLIGDVPAGVMLNQKPIFLGGQGGLVGPVRIGYGTVVAAGTICRWDCPEDGKTLGNNTGIIRERGGPIGLYRDIRRKVRNNVIYIANLLALRQWYIHVRQPFFKTQKYGPELFQRAVETLELMIGERLKRFRDFSEKMDTSIRLGEQVLPESDRRTILVPQKELRDNWPAIENCFTDGREGDIGVKDRNDFLERIDSEQDRGGVSYIKAIQGLQNVTAGTEWLRHIVEQTTNQVLGRIPSCQ